jgi:hypothetical protein
MGPFPLEPLRDEGDDDALALAFVLELTLGAVPAFFRRCVTVPSMEDADASITLHLVKGEPLPKLYVPFYRAFGNLSFFFKHASE